MDTSRQTTLSDFFKVSKKSACSTKPINGALLSEAPSTSTTGSPSHSESLAADSIKNNMNSSGLREEEKRPSLIQGKMTAESESLDTDTLAQVLRHSHQSQELAENNQEAFDTTCFVKNLVELFLRIRATSLNDVRRSDPNAHRNGSFHLVLPQLSRSKNSMNAFLNFESTDEGTTIRLISTFVHASWRGLGAGHLLCDAALQFAKKHNLKVEVICPYVKTVFLPRLARLFPEDPYVLNMLPELNEQEKYHPTCFYRLPHHPSYARSWRRVQAVMATKISSTHELVNAFYHLFHDNYDANFQFVAKGLASFLEDVLPEAGLYQTFFSKTLPFIQVLIMELPRIMKDACTWGNSCYLPLLRRRSRLPLTELTLPKIVLAALNACAFFCVLHPLKDSYASGDESSRGTRLKYHECSYRRMYVSQLHRPQVRSKLLCLMNYFNIMHDRVVEACKQGDPHFKSTLNMSGSVTFYRTRAHLTPFVQDYIMSKKSTLIDAKLQSDPQYTVTTPIPVWKENVDTRVISALSSEVDGDTLNTSSTLLMHQNEATGNKQKSNSFNVTMEELGRFAVGSVATDVILDAIRNNKGPLSPVKVITRGTIENESQAHTLQVDFANAYIGGGALGSGCVQEEIRFMINPECIPAIMFVEALESNEAVLILGAERFSNYKGYASTFEYAGAHEDPTPFDSKNRISTAILAIDAVNYSSPDQQYKLNEVSREILKAYVGFSIPKGDFDADGVEVALDRMRKARLEQANVEHLALMEKLSEEGEVDPEDREEHLWSMQANANSVYHEGSGRYQSVSTGNWGCGAFNGDHQLKFLIQWIASSAANLSMRYFTFEDARIDGLEDFVNAIVVFNDGMTQKGYKHFISPNSIWDLIASWIRSRLSKFSMSDLTMSVGDLDVRKIPSSYPSESLFDYITRCLTTIS